MLTPSENSLHNFTLAGFYGKQELFEYVKAGTVPVVDVRANQALGVKLEFAPTWNRNSWLPGYGNSPA
ncbi:hypothetical protein OSCI_30009 [Kamptonema sp. PCC 6506]|nr:hypothetical protein OSCI_30009 [Kamptonema sp. PCC 6506]